MLRLELLLQEKKLATEVSIGQKNSTERAQQFVVLGWVRQQFRCFPLDLNIPVGFNKESGPRALCRKMLRASSALSPEPCPRCLSDMDRASPVPCGAAASREELILGRSVRECLGGLHLAVMLPCLELNPSEGILLVPVVKHLTRFF